MSDYPCSDLKDIFTRKAEARLERAKMPYGQKVLIVEKMRREVQPLREAGRRRRAQLQAAKDATVDKEP